MAVMPGAIYKPVARFNTPMAAYNRLNLHIAVSEAASLYPYFAPAGRPCSHFYVRYDGTVEQYVDTRFRAGSDYQGNDATISVETQGGYPTGGGSWTPQQVAALARIYRWVRAVHGIANKMAVDSRVGASSHGLSYHRFGIDPWRVSGGMHYSTKPGKICPTDARIAQITTIFALSQDTPAPAPVPPVPPVDPLVAFLEETKMPLPRYYRLDGTNLAYEDFGNFRRAATRAQYDYTSSQYPKGISIGVLPAYDRFWGLPIVGPHEGELYQKPGEPHVWALLSRDGVFGREWITAERYAQLAKPGFMQVAVGNIMWNLPIIGPDPFAK